MVKKLTLLILLSIGLFILIVNTTLAFIGEPRKDNTSAINSEVQASSLRPDKIYGAEPNPMKEPIGGGVGYTKIISKYNIRVNNKAELLSALGNAKNGDIIYIADSSTIDLSGSEKIKIPGGVSIASGRGYKGSLGALLISTELKTYPMFYSGGENIRLTGMRFCGPDTDRRTAQMKQLFKEGGHKSFYSIPNSIGISSAYSNTQIDNCEFWGWSHSAVLLSPGKKIFSDRNYIHNNYFHHNQRSGLGYGVSIDSVQVLIEGNLFDWCRHGIAGTGKPGTSYEARYNIVLEHFSEHAFDMHGGADRKDGTNIAGNSILIHHNTFKLVEQSAIVIRGRPIIKAEIYNNLFYNPDSSLTIKQIAEKGNMKIYNNKYGVQK
jgi:hypothetical protein